MTYKKFDKFLCDSRNGDHKVSWVGEEPGAGSVMYAAKLPSYLVPNGSSRKSVTGAGGAQRARLVFAFRFSLFHRSRVELIEKL